MLTIPHFLISHALAASPPPPIPAFQGRAVIFGAKAWFPVHWDQNWGPSGSFSLSFKLKSLISCSL